MQGTIIEAGVLSKQAIHSHAAYKEADKLQPIALTNTLTNVIYFLTSY